MMITSLTLPYKNCMPHLNICLLEYVRALFFLVLLTVSVSHHVSMQSLPLLLGRHGMTCIARPLIKCACENWKQAAESF